MEMNIITKIFDERKNMGNLIFTKEEEALTKSCEDFCPIYEAIRQYNNCHTHNIYCATEMCKNISIAYALNRRETENAKNENLG